MSNSHDGARDEFSGTIKIIGLGQSLRGDDAAGLAAVRLWQERYQVNTERPNLQVELAELPGIGLLSLLEGAGMAILVDAVHSGADAGTIHILSKEHLEAFQKESGSAHGWGVGFPQPPSHGRFLAYLPQVTKLCQCTQYLLGRTRPDGYSGGPQWFSQKTPGA